jgi:hypothetical protein
MHNEKRNAVHACGTFSAATPPVITNAGTGNWSVVRNGAGSWDVTLADPIDATERTILVQSKVTSTMAGTIVASDTDTVFRINCESDGSVATDSAIDFMVLRAAA